jgi:hypothetical protein
MSDPNPAPQSDLDRAIADVHEELRVLNADTKEHANATDQLVKLHKLKMDEEKLSLENRNAAHQRDLDARPKPVSKDALTVAAANLLGIGLIIWHERDHVMNRTALDFLKRLR